MLPYLYAVIFSIEQIETFPGLFMQLSMSYSDQCDYDLYSKIIYKKLNKNSP